jgi:hypothetical protein
MTVFDAYLRGHNQIEMVKKKEVYFFDYDENFIFNVDYSKYHGFFDQNLKDKIKGEATPIYMYWYEAPKRIWKYNPNMKIIAVLRNPIDRAYSHWNMEHNRNADSSTFSDAIRSEKERCREALPLQHRVYSYIDRGFYTDQLRRLWHFFPIKQTLIVKQEDLKYDPEKVLSQISMFLNIDKFQRIEPIDIHAGEYKFDLLENDRVFLKEIFYFEIKELEYMLGWDCSDWLKF